MRQFVRWVVLHISELQVVEWPKWFAIGGYFYYLLCRVPCSVSDIHSVRIVHAAPRRRYIVGGHGDKVYDERTALLVCRCESGIVLHNPVEAQSESRKYFRSSRHVPKS